MSLVVLENVSLMLGGKAIVDDLSLRFAQGDRVGLIGPNGSGKTTLLRLMAKQQMPDGGAIRIQKGSRIGYLPQDVTVEGGRTLLQLVIESVPGRAELERELETAEADLERKAVDVNADDYEEVMIELGGRVGELHERLADFERLYSEHEAKRIMAGLGFKTSDHDRDVGEFSGGWKMRVVLSSLLFGRPDLLMMDEPTNHLDLPSVAWLSAFMRKYDRSFILISHDREFLNEQIDRVVSFESEGVRQYKGDLDSYKKQRDEERVLLENRARNVAQERERLERFVTRFKAKASKASQAQSKLRQLEKLETVEILGDRAVMSFRFPEVQRSGKIALEVEGLTKSYGDHEVLTGVDLLAKRGQRIALLGVNGAGKTTLLRILAGEIEATGGSYEFGHNTKVGYYAQHHAESLDRKLTVYDSVARMAGDVTNQRIRAVLGAMLFGDREIDKSVGVLSGGERARVALAQLLIDPGNVLLMDEPTNHLDLESSERLAEALQGYEGTLLFVSHNRYFIRKLAKQIWFVEDGKVVVYPGTLNDYLARCRLAGEDPAAAAVSGGGVAARVAPGSTAGGAKGTPSSKQQSSNTQSSNAAKRPAPSESKSGGSSKKNGRGRTDKRLKPLQRRARELEKRIADLETAQAERTAALSDPSVYEDQSRSQEVQAEYQRAQAELEVAMETWTEVTEELESLQ